MGVKTDLSVKIGSLILQNPIITASGTFGYNTEYENYMDLNKIGALVTKGITLNPKPGNPQPRIKEVPNGLINSIGLENIGIHAFIQEKLPVLNEKNIPFIVNVAGESLEEYKEIAKICQNSGIKAIELNLSCPNVEKGCLEFGRDEETLYRLISGVREVFTETIIVKLGTNISFPEKIVSAIQKAGADAISAINTVKSMHVTINDNYNGYKFIKGGMSGRCIKPVALNFIYEIRQYTDLPIIGMGGICSLDDVLEFMAVGADAVQIGTGTFTQPDISEKIATELESFMENKHFKSICEVKGNIRQRIN